MPPLTDRLPPAGLRLRVGLLGGSFNPAHDGHLHVSREALRRLGLDEVWWMVSPQNPLKDTVGMAPFETRVASARAAARDRRIRVTDIERRLGTRYTAHTLACLRARRPRHRFVWLMGADNLHQMSRWRGWTSIFNFVPVAVFARPTYSFRALSGVAAVRYARARVSERRAARLADMGPPAWTYLFIPYHPASATAIRAGQRPGRVTSLQGGET